MFKLTFTTLFSLFFFSVVVSGALVPRKDPPKGWWFAGLEDYHVYHARYLALGCQFQHGKTFFDECCHPLLKDQKLSDRPAECTPSEAASSSAAAAEPTSTVTTPADGDDDGDDNSETVTVTSTAATASASDDGDDDDCDDDGDDGDNDGDDDSTTVEISTSPVATSTHAAASTTAPAATPTTTSHSSSSSSSTVHTASTHSTTKTSSSAKATATSSSGSGDFVTGGFATFFFQNGVAGACGTVHSDSDLIAAIDSRRYGNTGEVSSLCGKKAQIINTENGKSVTVTIADACPTCENSNCMDLSQGAFDQIADESEGIVSIKWQFLD